VLLTTQYLDEADHLAGHVVIIDHGRAIAQGTPAELKRRFGSSMIEVYAADRHHLPVVAQALARLDHAQPHADQATRRVSAALPDTPGGLAACLQALEAIGVAADDITLRPATLDEVFLTLTGGPAPSNGARPQPVSHR